MRIFLFLLFYIDAQQQQPKIAVDNGHLTFTGFPKSYKAWTIKCFLSDQWERHSFHDGIRLESVDKR